MAFFIFLLTVFLTVMTANAIKTTFYTDCGNIEWLMINIVIACGWTFILRLLLS